MSWSVIFPKLPNPLLRQLSRTRYGHRSKLSEEQRHVLLRLEETTDHIFITGKAGSGKSLLLKHFAATTKKTIVKVAPTGVAAMAVKGQTIHSLFKLPTGYVDLHKLRLQDETRRLLKHVDVVIIDEISMVRADVIDGIDHLLRLAKRSKLPFGGVQLIMFGDVYQLPPVVESPALAQCFAEVYGGPYFFNARVWKNTPLLTYELHHVFRQRNALFRDALDAVRTNAASDAELSLINTRLTDEDEVPLENTITLTTTNKIAQTINRRRLTPLKGTARVYHALVTDSPPTTTFPTEQELTLKVGAQVVFIKNDPEHRWVNGTIGTVKSLGKHSVRVRCGKQTYDVSPTVWEQFEYHYDEKKQRVTQEVASTFTQLPFKLAWAITIHKSQGATYDSVIIDIGSGAFAHGQTYVALSRCRTLEGLYLRSEILPRDIIVDPAVVAFMRTARTA